MPLSVAEAYMAKAYAERVVAGLGEVFGDPCAVATTTYDKRAGSIIATLVINDRRALDAAMKPHRV